ASANSIQEHSQQYDDKLLYTFKEVFLNRDGNICCQELDPLKGDKLVSSLDRNSAGSRESTALASPADTSGHPDKVPVLAQHAESAACSSTENVLPRHGILAWNPTVQLERYHAGELSLSSELGRVCKPDVESGV